jgi:hypothetical protein
MSGYVAGLHSGSSGLMRHTHNVRSAQDAQEQGCVYPSMSALLYHIKTHTRNNGNGALRKKQPMESTIMALRGGADEGSTDGSSTVKSLVDRLKENQSIIP